MARARVLVVEEALRRAERKFRDLLDSMGDAVFIHELGGRILEVNQAACRSVAYSREDLLLMSLADLRLAEDAARPDDRAAQLRRDGHVSAELTLVRRDGARLPVELTSRLFEYEQHPAVLTVARDLSERRRAETQLISAYERLRDFVDIVNRSPVIVYLWRVSEGWPIEFVSENVSQFGYTSEELTSEDMSWLQLIHPDDARTMKSEVADALQEGCVQFRNQFRTASKSGDVRWVEAESFPIRDPDGTITHVQGIAIDITERRRVEEELRRERDKAERYLRIADVMFLALNEKGRVTLINPKGCRILGYAEEEILGADWFETCLPPGGVEYVRRVFNRLMSGEVAPLAYVENEVLTKSGERRTILWHNTLLTDDAGMVRGTFASGEDITERKRAEKAREDSEAKWRSLAEHAPDIVFTVDREGTILFINHPPEGLTREETVGTCALDHVAPEYRQTVAEAIERVFQTGRPGEYEISAPGPHGALSWHSARLGPIKHEDEVVAVILITRDITERKQAEHDLRERGAQLQALTARLHSVREEERTRLSRTIHDELGHSLAALKMDLSWLAKRVTEAGDALPQPQSERRTSSMMEMLDNGVRSARQIASELRPGVLDDIGLAAALEWQAKQFESRTGIRCDVTGTSEDVRLDREQSTALYRICEELLTNVACHANSSAVHVALTQKDAEVVLTVRDDGKGITSAEACSSNSLGLLGVRERARLASAEFAISGAPGEGTTAIVRVRCERARGEQD